MLRTLHVEGYRGFRSLTVEGLGRVNLVIGRNNCGKSSLLEVACLAASNAPETALTLLELRRGWGPPPSFHSLFHHASADGRVSVRAVAADEAQWTVELSLAEGQPVVRGTPSADARRPETWISTRGPFAEKAATMAYERMYVDGRSEPVVAALRHLEPTLESVDIVGEGVWVKHRGVARRLPLSSLGEGARWMFDIAVSIHRGGHAVQGFDEIDDGLHHSVLGSVFTLLRSAPVACQIFATTHRDETIRAACRVFQEASDDGLRVVRLDRRPDGTHRAVVYDAATALRALDEGWEIRG